MPGSGRLAPLLLLTTFAACGEELSPLVNIPLPPRSEPAPLPPLAPVRPDSVAPRTPQEFLATVHLPPGYRLELVAAEPMVIEPVLCTWDGNGRMYVAELRTYVQDVDGTDTNLPNSRIVVLEDRDGDGRMDWSATFADSLVLHRMVLPLGNRVLVQETYDGILWSYRDEDGDGRADSREELYRYPPSKANLEHQDSALTLTLDNWIYTAMGGVRHRVQPDGSLHTEKVPSSFAQWGLAVDDLGRQFFSSAGGERPAFGFEQHPTYGRIQVPGTLAEGFMAVWPAIALPDVQGGTGRLRENGTLNHFTGCCGQSVFRGDALPEDLRGDLLICEPVGRLVRRARIDRVDGRPVLRNPYDRREFLASTDANFRPIWSATGPDGCLYLVDMYRGIIQESNWTRKGSYLRPQIVELGLDHNIGRGRIWRLVHEDFERAPVPRLRDLPAPELVPYLEHRNGALRDQAQKLLVLDRPNSAIAAVRALSRGSNSALGRIHGLWTLEGLDALRPDDVRRAFRDPDPRVRQSAVRAAECFLKAGDGSFVRDLGILAADPEIDVRIQVLQSVRYLDSEPMRDLAMDLMVAHQDNEFVARVGASTLAWGHGDDAPAFASFSAAELALWRRGREIYRTMCAACHGEDGKGAPSGDLRLAPPLVGSRRLLLSDQAAARILLHGMTGPVDGTTYPNNLMISHGAQGDAWMAGTITYARNSFGNRGEPMAPQTVARIRAATADRATPFTGTELDRFLPLRLDEGSGHALSASHGSDSLPGAVDSDRRTRYTTGTAMRPGMWLQIEFATPHRIERILWDTAGSARDYPRGYRVLLSEDGQRWSEPVAEGAPDGPLVHMVIPAPRPARFLRIEQTGRTDKWWWSIHDLLVYGTNAGG